VTLRVLRVPHGDVARNTFSELAHQPGFAFPTTFGESLSCEYPKRYVFQHFLLPLRTVQLTTRHVVEDPCAVLVVRGEEGDAREADALRDGLQGCQVLYLCIFGARDELFALRKGRWFDGDGGGCHGG
jgi:hypothetical protein